MGEASLVVLLAILSKANNEDRFVKMTSYIFVAYLVGVFAITLGFRSSENAGETNLVLFNAFRRMFAPTFYRLQEWGFPKGLQELKWIGYKSWESIILNLLLMIPFGLLFPIVSRLFDRWWIILAGGCFFSLFIETAQLVFQRGWFDVDDIFLNVMGVLVGLFIYKPIIKRNIRRD